MPEEYICPEDNMECGGVDNCRHPDYKDCKPKNPPPGEPGGEE